MLDKKVVYFMTVVEEKSFSKAAQKLYLSQPNLSKQVQQLEKELGVLLLNREGYRPVLTTAGEYYYQEMKKIQNCMECIEDKIRAMDYKEIRIAFTGSYENRRILESFNSIRGDFKNEKISFIKYNFEESIGNLLDGTVDISFGIESNYRKHPEVQYKVLYSYNMCVICSFDHPFAKCSYIIPSQLKEQELIVLSKKSGQDFYHDFMRACKKDGYVPKVKKEVDNFDELVFEVSLGEGIAIVSKDVVRESDVRVVDFKQTNHASCYVIAKLKENHNPVVEKLFTEITEYFKKDHN